MARTALRPAVYSVLVALVACSAVVSLRPSPPILAQAPSGQPSTRNGEWPHYSADLHGTRYSPLDQITGDNFNKLEVAWRFKTDSLGRSPNTSSRARRSW